jgi:hypothetical protein
MKTQFPVHSTAWHGTAVSQNRITFLTYINGLTDTSQREVLLSELGMRMSEVGLDHPIGISAEPTTITTGATSTIPVTRVTVELLLAGEDEDYAEIGMYQGILYALILLITKRILPTPSPLI